MANKNDTENVTLTEICVDRYKRQASTSPSELQRDVSPRNYSNSIWGSNPPPTPHHVQLASDCSSPIVHTPYRHVTYHNMDNMDKMNISSHVPTHVPNHPHPHHHSVARKTLDSQFGNEMTQKPCIGEKYQILKELHF